MLEYLGYLASVVILISLLMTSVQKLRWINLIGSLLFAIYGFMISSIPVGIMNSGIVVVNIYFLWKMYTSKDYFTVLPLTNRTQYFEYFVNYHKSDIANYANIKDLTIAKDAVAFYILRNAVPAGVFVGVKENETTLCIKLDYVTKAYRDFKMGEYVFRKQKNLFTSKGYQTLVTHTDNPKHAKYLQKMGFTKVNNDTWQYPLE
ncbi:MAG: hypothetical protein AB7S88_02550 [Candidatus Izemoplasmatales bacterium]